MRQNHYAVMPLSRASTRGRYSRIVGITINVSDISNIPNTLSLLLVCARIAIAVRVLWFYLNPGRFQAHADVRHGSFLGTYQTGCTFTMPGTSQKVHDYKPCTIGRHSHTFSSPALYVIVSHITQALQTTTVCIVAHVSTP